MTSFVISAIVPTLNRPTDLVALAETLLEQTVPVQELVVVDAGSPEHEVEDCLRRALSGSSLELVYARAAPSTSGQRNRAIELAKGEILLFFDDDVLLDADFVERCLECFELGFDPPVGGVLGTFTTFPPPTRFRDAFHRVFGMSHAGPGDTPQAYRSGCFRTLIRPSRVVPVHVMSGGRSAFRRECFATERFSEYLPGYIPSEDVELSYRVAKRWTLVHTPHARLHHKRSPTNRLARWDRLGRLLYSRYYFFRKHVPRDTSHTAAFIWSNLGFCLWTFGSALQRPQTSLTVVQGLAYGAYLCATNARGLAPR